MQKETKRKHVFNTKFSESFLNITALNYYRVVTEYRSPCDLLLLLTGSTVDKSPLQQYL